MKTCMTLLASLLLLLSLVGCRTTVSAEESGVDRLDSPELGSGPVNDPSGVEDKPMGSDITSDSLAELGYDISFEISTCKFEVPSWLEGQCGTLTVPEDRSKPEGNVVKLPVVIFHSTNPNPAPDPVIYLTGGGGGNELDNIQRYNSVIMNVIRDRDYIMYNQRGAKYGEPYLICPGIHEFEVDLVVQNLSIEESEAQKLTFLEECSEGFRASGIDLNQYNSAVNAADLNDLRLAMGYGQVNIYGTSYGTRLALAVLRDFPEALRSAIIDSVYPPQVDFFSEYGVNMHQAFNRVFDACEADEECRQSYPDLEEVLVRLVEGLNQSLGTVSYVGKSLFFDGGEFMDALYFYPKAHHADQLPAAIYRASKGDYSYVETIIPYVLGVVPSDTIAGGVQKSMFCREEVPYESYDRLLELNESIPSPYTYTFATDFYWRMCDIWGVDPAEPYVNEPVFSDVPTLVLGGIYDPITPIEWSRFAAETLANSYYYEFPGGHGIMRTFDCGRSIGLQFLENPWAEPDASCIEHMESPDFQ